MVQSKQHIVSSKGRPVPVFRLDKWQHGCVCGLGNDVMVLGPPALVEQVQRDLERAFT
jgi:hypothetical protein